MQSQFDLPAYLGRIGLPVKALTADENTLKMVSNAQAFTIPFENFDVQLGRRVQLEPENLVHKLVHNRRGGYCFELNGLLMLALQSLGFEVRPLLARVHFRGEHLGRTHQLCLISLNGQDWVADVGFGGGCGLLEPAALIYGEAFEQAGQRFRFMLHNDYGTMLQLFWQDGDQAAWKNIYSFDNEKVERGDIEMGNFFASNSPQSVFTQMPLATMPTPDGRVSLTSFELKIIKGNTQEQIVLPGGDDYLAALEGYFGIALDAAFSDLKPIKKPA